MIESIYILKTTTRYRCRQMRNYATLHILITHSTPSTINSIFYIYLNIVLRFDRTICGNICDHNKRTQEGILKLKRLL